MVEIEALVDLKIRTHLMFLLDRTWIITRIKDSRHLTWVDIPEKLTKGNRD